MRLAALPRSVRGVAGLLALTLTGGVTSAAVMDGQPAPAVASAAAPGAVPGAGGPQKTVSPEDRQLQALVDARAKAVLSHDRAAFLATVDPANTRFRRSQANVIDALARVPLSTWSYDLGGANLRAAPVDVDVLRSGGRSRGVQASFRYGLRGFDNAASGQPRTLTFTRRKGRWYVSGDKAEALDGLRATFLWEHGPVAVVRGRRSLVLGHPANAARMRTLAAETDAAVPRVSAVWGRDWSQRVVLVVPSTQRELGSLTGSGDSLDNIAGIAASDATLDRATVNPARVFLNPTVLRKYDRLNRKILLDHEITHVAAWRSSGDMVPAWLIEGLAEHTAYLGTGLPRRQLARELGRDVRAGRTPRHLAENAAFDGDNPHLDEIYESSWLAVELLLEKYGRARTLRLYRELGAAAGFDEDVVLEDRLHRVLGTSLKAFTADWRRYLRTSLG